MGATVKIAILAQAQAAKREFADTGDAARKAGRDVEKGFDGVGDKVGREFKGVGDDARREFGDVGQAAGRAGDDAEQGFRGVGDRIGAQFRGAADSAGQAMSGITGKVQSIVGGLAGAAKGGALAAGAVIGAALAAGIAQNIGTGQVTAKLQAQLGLSKDEAAKAGKIAGQVYSANFGEDITQVGEAVRRVYQDIGRGTDAWARDTTAAVLTVSSAFEQDLGGTTRAVGQLLRTGLAKDAQEALDVLTVGFQKGGDKADDLLATFNEYGTQFRKLGLDAETATGILVQGLQAGARDADIVADAIKEFSIRAIDGSKLTAEAFRGLGLDAKQMAEDIAGGGPKATAALDEVLDRLRGVEDPVQRAKLAVALFGTQAEDLGGALLAIDPSSAVGALGQVEGAAKKAGDALADETTAKIEAFKRTLTGWSAEGLDAVVSQLGSLVDRVPASVWDGISQSVKALKDAVGDAAGAWKDFFASLTGGKSDTELLLQALRGLRVGIDLMVIGIDGLVIAYSTTTAAVFGLIAGFKLLTGDVDGAKEAWARAKTAADTATGAVVKQTQDVDALKQHWNEGGKAIQKANQDAAAAAVVAGKTTGDAHDRGATQSSTAYRRLAADAKTSATQSSAAHKSAASDTQSGWAAVPGRVKASFSGLGGILVSSGRSIMDGLLSGLEAGWARVRSFLSSVTSQIPSWKGPPARDRKLLARSGELIMGGFLDGLESQYGDVQASLKGFTGRLAADAVGPEGSITARVDVTQGAGRPAAPAATVLELRSSGSRLDDLLLEVLRGAIRVRGGDVQLVLGRA